MPSLAHNSGDRKEPTSSAATSSEPFPPERRRNAQSSHHSNAQSSHLSDAQSSHHSNAQSSHHSNAQSSDLMVPGLGSLVTLLSTKQIRYEGALYSANLDQNKITLANVRCFGTEDRTCARPVRPSDAVYEYVVFSAGSIVRMEITQGCPVLLPKSAPMRRDPAVCLVTTFGRKWGPEEQTEGSQALAESGTTSTTSTAVTAKAPGSRRLRFFPRRHSTGSYAPRTFASQLTAVPEEGSAQMLVAAGMEDYPEVETARHGASPPLAVARSPEAEVVMGSPPEEHYAPGDEDSTPGDEGVRRTRRRADRRRARAAPGEEDSTHGDEDSAPGDEGAAARRRPRRRRRRRHTAPDWPPQQPTLQRSWSRDSGCSLFSMLEGLLSPVPAFSPRPGMKSAVGRLQEVQRQISEVLVGFSTAPETEQSCPEPAPQTADS